VYGVESATYHFEKHGADANWKDFPVVKTHLLPHQLPEELLKRKVVYLIRNGGDAVVSLAHHRKDVIDPSSDFQLNLWETIYSAEGAHFGGWSHHVEQWLPKADEKLHFEEFISNPKEALTAMRPFLDLGIAEWDKLPSFQELKHGNPEYGSGKHLGLDLAQHWFRSGKVNVWRGEMSEEQTRMYWHLHGEAMEYAGYSLEGEEVTRQYDVMLNKRVLIEAEKLAENGFDGVKRYVFELIKSAQRFPILGLEVRVLFDGKIMDMHSVIEFEGRGSSPIKNGALHALKSLANLILPKTWYAELAKRFPIHRLRRAKKVEGYESTPSKTDILHLTLPQHFAFAEGIERDNTIVTIHDTTHHSHAEFHQPNNVARTAAGFEFIQENGAVSISVSESTQRDADALGIESSVVYEGVDRRSFFPLQNEHLLHLVRDRYSLPDRFILSLSTLEPRKNIQRLIDAYDALDLQVKESCHLVLAGSKGWGSELKIPDSSADYVHFTGFVREDHLAALYNLAHGFAYVSLYEGFGLPVLEALACGTAVLVSNTSSLPEIVGEVAFRCDPFEVDAISTGLHNLMRCDNDELKPRCMEQSWKFSWKDCWLGTVDVYSRTIG